MRQAFAEGRDFTSDARGGKWGTENERKGGASELSAGRGDDLTCCWWRKAGSLGLRPTKRLAVGVPGAE